MLIYGRFQDENGVKYHVPSITTNDHLNKEQQIVETARRIARKKGVRVVRIWAVYETEREIRQ
jgi:hypothetical protein